MMEEENESSSSDHESGEDSDEAHIAKLIQVLEMDNDDIASSSSEDSQDEEFRNKCEILGPSYLLDKNQSRVTKCIDANYAVRDTLKKGIEYVHTLINENAAKEREAKKWAEENQNSMKDQISSNSTIRKFGFPYFKDGDSFPCPASKDAIVRQKLCANISHADSRNKWQNWEMLLLERSVQNTALEQLRAPLEDQKQRLCEQLKAEENAGLSSDKTKRLIDDIINKIHNQAGDALFEMLSDESSSLDWMKISAQCFEGKRSASVCESMWKCCLRPGISRDMWTVQELNQLMVLAKQHNYSDWDTIAKKLNSGRTAYLCFIQMQTVLNKTRSIWTREEDLSLKSAVDFFRVGDYIPFDKVIGLLPGRTVAQISDRWENELDPELRFGSFTPREDLVIIVARQSFQMSFSQIAGIIPGRSMKQVRLRFLRLLEMKKDKSYIPQLQELMKEADNLDPRTNSKTNQSASVETEEQSAEKDGNEAIPSPVSQAPAAPCALPVRPVIKMPIVPQALPPTNIPKLVQRMEINARKKRKGRIQCPGNKDISRLFRSFYHQPQGRIKKAFYHDTFDEMATDARSLAQLLHCNVEQSHDDRLLRRRDAEALILLYHQMSSVEDFVKPKCYMPPCVTTLIGLRTLLIEERNLFRLCLQNRSTEDISLAMKELKMVENKGSKESGTSKTARGTFEPVAGTSKNSGTFEPVAGTSKNSGTYEPVAGTSNTTFEPTTDETRHRKDNSVSPKEAFQLFKDRFLTLMLWPAILTRIAPYQEYYADLFEGTRMACASDDDMDDFVKDPILIKMKQELAEEIQVEPELVIGVEPELVIGVEPVEEIRVVEPAEELEEERVHTIKEEPVYEMGEESVYEMGFVYEMEEAPPVVQMEMKTRPWNKYERKRRMKARWDNYRQKKIKTMQEAGLTPQILHERDEREKIAEAKRFKDSLVLHIPGKIGRPARRRRTRKKANPMEQIQELPEPEEVHQPEDPKVTQVCEQNVTMSSDPKQGSSTPNDSVSIVWMPGKPNQIIDAKISQTKAIKEKNVCESDVHPGNISKQQGPK